MGTAMGSARPVAGVPGTNPDLVARLREPLLPALERLDVFLREWQQDLRPEQVRVLSSVARDGRGALRLLDEALDAKPVAVPVPDGPPPVGAGGRDEPVRIEDAVPVAVAGLLQAEDEAELLDTVCALVRACGGRVALSGRGPSEALRELPDVFHAAPGAELTLGPVLRALCAAASERASGVLAPPRRERRRRDAGPGGGTGASSVLLSLDLGDVGAVRDRLGDPGARWLIAKLQRTLRSLLQPDERALRYPARRFLILLHRTTPERAQTFSERIGWEWNSYLGRVTELSARQAEVHGDDVVEALRRLG
jgi:hypothetical protein